MAAGRETVSLETVHPEEAKFFRQNFPANETFQYGDGGKYRVIFINFERHAVEKEVRTKTGKIKTRKRVVFHVEEYEELCPVVFKLLTDTSRRHKYRDFLVYAGYLPTSMDSDEEIPDKDEITPLALVNLSFTGGDTLIEKLDNIVAHLKAKDQLNDAGLDCTTSEKGIDDGDKDGYSCLIA